MPPAEKATIARIGLVGQACAHASPFAKARARTDSNMKQIRVMPFSSYRGGHCVEDLSKGQQPVGFRAKDSTHRHGRLLHHPPGRYETIAVTPPKIFSKEVAQNRPPHFLARTSLSTRNHFTPNFRG